MSEPETNQVKFGHNFGLKTLRRDLFRARICVMKQERLTDL